MDADESRVDDETDAAEWNQCQMEHLGRSVVLVVLLSCAPTIRHTLMSRLVATPDLLMDGVTRPGLQAGQNAGGRLLNVGRLGMMIHRYLFQLFGSFGSLSL